jgi:hypothetical protein
MGRSRVTASHATSQSEIEFRRSFMELTAMAVLEIKILTHKDGQRRVLIFGRDGHFSFAEEELVSDCYGEPCWVPVAHGRTSRPICDTEETAEREARARVHWLAEGS